MTTLTEGNLQITFPAAAKPRKFDDASHGLSHCMKAVDFIAELKDRYYFIEFKDPHKPGVPQKERDEYVRNFLAGNIDEDFKYKCRDTFLYEWAAERVGWPVQNAIGNLLRRPGYSPKRYPASRCKKPSCVSSDMLGRRTG